MIYFKMNVSNVTSINQENWRT